MAAGMRARQTGARDAWFVRATFQSYASFYSTKFLFGLALRNMLKVK